MTDGKRVAGAELPEWMIPKTGFVCESPVRYNFQSEMFVRACGRCKRCEARKKRDISGRAAAEAALAAEVVAFTLTYGTLKPFPADGRPWVQDVDPESVAGARDFVTRDRQLFMMRLRSALVYRARKAVGRPSRLPNDKPGVTRHGYAKPVHQTAHVRAYWNARVAAATPRVRYLGVGERGTQGTLRCHWHILCFGSLPMGFVTTARDAKGQFVRELHPLWQKGWCTVDVLPSVETAAAMAVKTAAEAEGQRAAFAASGMSRKMKAVRYCSAYVTKASAVTLRERRRGVPAQAMFFRSTATPLGYEYLMDHARRVAAAGLPLRGTYQVPGVTNSKPRTLCVPGVRDMSYNVAARPSVFTVQGRMRDHFIAGYRAEWERLRPDKSIPRTDWLARFDPEWADAAPVADSGRCRLTPLPVDSVAVIGNARSVGHAGGLMLVRDARGLARGVVQVRASGFAAFRATDGPDYSVRDGGLRDLPGLTEGQHRQIEAWIAEKRGPHWVDPRDVRVTERERLRGLRASVERWAKDSPNIERMSHLPPVQALTALRRKLALFGNGHIAGTVVRDVRDPLTVPAQVRDTARLRRPVSERGA